MKVTLSKTITCKLLFRVQGLDPIDEGSMRKPITGRVAHTVHFVKRRRRISENEDKRENQQEKKP